MYEWHGYGGGMMMWIFWVIILIAMIWIIASSTRRRDGSERREKSALELLEERYAKGEINRDEFQQKRNDLIQ